MTTEQERDRMVRLLIADALGVTPEQVTVKMRDAYDHGQLDEGAYCVLPPWYGPPIGSHPDFDLARDIAEMGRQ